MKRATVCAAMASILLAVASCSGYTGQKDYKKFSYDFTGTFDTLITVTGYASDAGEFDCFAKRVEAEMRSLSKIFDRYKSYDNINNIKTINENAGLKPVLVDREIINAVKLGKSWYQKSGGTVNIAMGPVLSIWHEYRERYAGDPENAVLPPAEELTAAAEKCDISKVIVDERESTVFLQEAGMSLDLGCMAKGYATQIADDRELGGAVKSYLINSGGNVIARGKPLDGVRQKWGIGIQNPDGNALIPDDEPLDVVFVNDCALVTSGDYQRYYVVNGYRYSHIIDPATNMPAASYRSVTVIGEKSGEADLLSTALFILPIEDGQRLAAKCGVDAVWVLDGGGIIATDGARARMKALGGATST